MYDDTSYMNRNHNFNNNNNNPNFPHRTAFPTIEQIRQSEIDAQVESSTNLVERLAGIGAFEVQDNFRNQPR
eukprot:UN10699